MRARVVRHFMSIVVGPATMAVASFVMPDPVTRAVMIVAGFLLGIDGSLGLLLDTTRSPRWALVAEWLGLGICAASVAIALA